MTSTTVTIAGMGPADVSANMIPEPRDEAVLAGAVDWLDAANKLSIARGRVTSVLDMDSVANGATEGDAQSWKVVSATTTVMTPGLKIAFILLTTARMRSTPANLEAVATGILQRAAMNELDSDICTAGSAGWTETGGDSAAALSLAKMVEGAALYRGSLKSGSTVGLFVLDDGAFADLEQESLTSQSTILNMGDRSLVDIFSMPPRSTSSAMRGKISNFPILITGNVVESASVKKNFLFRPAMNDAIGGGIGGAWDYLEDKAQIDSQRGNRIAGKSASLEGRWSVAVQNPDAGVLLESAA